ncbi:TetR/AcrR family transcriptional regulator [Paeniglutamicibacter sp. Y32M11]|uniref:TetR/AcrR family transcriptional regulator n=1 Tax=Paeniglutamicibacter sp. Y32M11 TaxID=2853258 RepID=UPI001C5273C8|nr:TetR/AcrR family transcriptional regulator [Paeniglutamicibacter sp. Y32M11]QXQ10274.1 TetR/AcrR family transcriptional regulator [Paeniglutamicibacter sp. Y32M11]
MADKTAPTRRTVILDNAARLFAQQGIGGTSVREISASVGMLSGSLYHHFASKDEMVEEVLTEFLEELQGRYRGVTESGAQPREALNQLIRITLEIIRDYPYATQIYQNEVAYIQKLPKSTGARAISSDIAKLWVEVIELGIESGIFKKDLDANVAHRLMRDSLWLTARWFTPSKKYTLDQLTADCSALFLDGIMA